MLQKSSTLTRVGFMNNVAQAGLDVFVGNYIVRKDMREPDLLLLRSAKVNTTDFPGVFAIARAGIGVNNIDNGDFKKATEHGICVFNTPGGNARAVAELVMTMIGARSRQIFGAVQFVRGIGEQTDELIEEIVEKEKSKFVGRELGGKTLGVIGLGRIGVLVANLAIQKGMQVVGYDSFITVHNALELSKGVKYVKTLDQLLEDANIITVHVPYTPENKHLIGAEQIGQMRNGTMLVNYARRGICDDAAVLAGIESGKLSSYITDFPTADLLRNPKVVATPHLGASTEESEEKCAVMAARQLLDFWVTGTVVNSVNFPTVELIPDRAVQTRLVVVNKDVPNMIGAITGALGESGVNISRSRNESNGVIGYNLIDINTVVAAEVIDKIGAVDHVLRVRAIPMNR